MDPPSTGQSLLTIMPVEERIFTTEPQRTQREAFVCREMPADRQAEIPTNKNILSLINLLLCALSTCGEPGFARNKSSPKASMKSSCLVRKFSHIGQQWLTMVYDSILLFRYTALPCWEDGTLQRSS